jgi:hypothetical protein
MSRIATLTAVLTMLVAPAALAGQDLRSPDTRDIAGPVTVDLRSPDAASPMPNAATPVTQDLRSPDARDVFAKPASKPQATPSDGGADWGIIGLIAGALAACAALAVVLRRHLQVGRPVGV